MKQRWITEEKGIALLVATAFIAVALIVLGALTARIINQHLLVDHYTSYENCIYGIESALAQSLGSLESGNNGMVGIDPGVAHIVGGVVPGFGSAGVTPVYLDSMPNVEYIAYAQNWSNDGIDNNGDGVVDGPEESGFFTIYPSARDQGAIRGAEVVLTGADVNVWRNAIFAGTGQSGGLVNGNVSIHGSVHLLGNNLIAGNPAIEAMDLTGTSLVHNNYVGIPASLGARIPSLSTRNFNGDTVQTLNAALRVKRGYVGTSGNSEIGEPDVPGNNLKETMDATYVNDGWTGTSVTPDGGRGDPRHVYSDNGWDAKYDLGDRVPMPTLADDWRDPNTGARQWDASRGAYYTHEHYFDEVLVGDPNNKTDGILTGNITIRANQDFYYNASRPSDTNPAHRLATDDYIYYTAANTTMQVNGQLTIIGNLTVLRGSGNQRTINYTGRAAVLVHGNVQLDTDLLTVNADGTTANSFPQQNALGVMASGDMTIGTVSQLSLMGAYYAQGRIICSKQTTVIGTFVANYFDMGTNVPCIYQVPSLADNLPHGMMGAYPIFVFSKVSWRELGI
jgi:hypothetical protein